MLREGVGERVAALDVVHHGPRDALQRLVLGLRGQDVQRLDQRQAGVDHRRELAGEDDDVARLHARTAQAQLDLLGRLANIDEDQAILAQVCADLVLARRVQLPLLDLARRGVAGGVFEHRHCDCSPVSGEPTPCARRRLLSAGAMS